MWFGFAHQPEDEVDEGDEGEITNALWAERSRSPIPYFYYLCKFLKLNWSHYGYDPQKQFIS